MTLNFHQKALLIGGVTLALMAGVFLWIVVLDKGTLSVTANTPYDISVTGSRLKVPEAQSCTSNPCALSLPSGEFTVTVAKSGHFDAVQSFTITRGDTTSLELELTFIPTVTEVILTEGATPVAMPELPTSSSDFSLVDDLTYGKQRLDYTDPETRIATPWVYFDRDVVDPLFFPNTDRTQVLVVDRSDTMNQLYWVDGVNFSRTWAGGLEDVESAVWSASDESIFLQAAGSTVLYHVELSTGTVSDWPLTNSLTKLAWNADGDLLFLTDQEISEETWTSVDLMEMALGGMTEPEEFRVFSVGEYTPSTDTYRLLYDVPASFELNYADTTLVFDDAAGAFYMTDGTRFFEIERGE